MPGDLFGSSGLQSIPLKGGDVRYDPNIDLGTDPSALFLQLRDTVAWRQEEIVVWGKRHPQPRLIAWFGDEGKKYAYSGIYLSPEPWTPVLLRIREVVESATTHTFNSVLLNYYRDNRDSMGFHSDDEPELGPRPTIASVSLGTARTFLLRSKTDHPPVTKRLRLESGSLLVMAGDTQKNWKHGIDKETSPCGGRINLTFRQILVA